MIESLNMHTNEFNWRFISHSAEKSIETALKTLLNAGPKNAEISKQKDKPKNNTSRHA